MTLLRLVECDGGRDAARFSPPASDRDCATRAISNGTDLPYTDVHAMVNDAAWRLGQLGDDPAETGADLGVADKILVEDRSWQRIESRGAAWLTVEDLERHLPQPQLSKYPALVVQTERLTRGKARPGKNEPLGHLTAVINSEVHDIKTLEEATAPGFARPDPVTVIYIPPADVTLLVAALHGDRHRHLSGSKGAE